VWRPPDSRESPSSARLPSGRPRSLSRQIDQAIGGGDSLPERIPADRIARFVGGVPADDGDRMPRPAKRVAHRAPMNPVPPVTRPARLAPELQHDQGPELATVVATTGDVGVEQLAHRLRTDHAGVEPGERRTGERQERTRQPGGERHGEAALTRRRIGPGTRSATARLRTRLVDRPRSFSSTGRRHANSTRW